MVRILSILPGLTGERKSCCTYLLGAVAIVEIITMLTFDLGIIGLL